VSVDRECGSDAAGEKEIPMSVAAAVSPVRWQVVFWLSLGMVLAYIDRVNLTAAMKPMAQVMNLDKAQQGMALSAFFWTYTVGQIPAGMLVDRYGVRMLYFIGIVLWSVASASTVLMGGLAGLVAVRLMVGLGESVVTSSSLRYIRTHFEEQKRGLAVGVYMTGTKIGPASVYPWPGFWSRGTAGRRCFWRWGWGACSGLAPGWHG
jgi:ACS family D-galactonate transporter-like MFS transporter